MQQATNLIFIILQNRATKPIILIINQIYIDLLLLPNLKRISNFHKTKL